jgi:hypothetical protein
MVATNALGNCKGPCSKYPLGYSTTSSDEYGTRDAYNPLCVDLELQDGVELKRRFDGLSDRIDLISTKEKQALDKWALNTGGIYGSPQDGMAWSTRLCDVLHLRLCVMGATFNKMCAYWAQRGLQSSVVLFLKTYWKVDCYEWAMPTAVAGAPKQVATRGNAMVRLLDSALHDIDTKDWTLEQLRKWAHGQLDEQPGLFTEWKPDFAHDDISAADGLPPFATEIKLFNALFGLAALIDMDLASMDCTKTMEIRKRFVPQVVTFRRLFLIMFDNVTPKVDMLASQTPRELVEAERSGSCLRAKGSIEASEKTHQRQQEMFEHVRGFSKSSEEKRRLYMFDRMLHRELFAAVRTQVRYGV